MAILIIIAAVAVLFGAVALLGGAREPEDTSGQPRTLSARRIAEGNFEGAWLLTAPDPIGVTEGTVMLRVLSPEEDCSKFGFKDVTAPLAVVSGDSPLVSVCGTDIRITREGEYEYIVKQTD